VKEHQISNFPVIVFTDGTKCYSGPNCHRHAGHTVSASVAADDFAAKMKKLDALYPVDPIRNETPATIDTELGRIYNEVYKIEDKIEVHAKYLKNYQQSMDPNYRYYREYEQERLQKGVDTQEAEIAKLQELRQVALELATPGEEEFNRRGGWTRAFLVTTGTGHVHKSRSCSTCYPTTRFVWLPEYSGGTEETIVDDAGKQACTVCYPSAPVDTLKRASRIEAPDRKAARLEREAAKAIRDKKNAEKSIFNPDGTPIKLIGRYGDRVNSHRMADQYAVDALVDIKAKESGKYQYLSEDAVREREANYALLLTALANKWGRTEEEQDKLLQDKATAKYKRDWK
jgi:hypothetical protein